LGRHHAELPPPLLPLLWLNAKHGRHFVASGVGEKQHGDDEEG
jgi:hypothetical protein